MLALCRRDPLRNRFSASPAIDEFDCGAALAWPDGHLFEDLGGIGVNHGLDQFIGMVLDDKAQTVLADLGAGSSKETY